MRLFAALPAAIICVTFELRLIFLHTRDLNSSFYLVKISPHMINYYGCYKPCGHIYKG